MSIRFLMSTFIMSIFVTACTNELVSITDELAEISIVEESLKTYKVSVDEAKETLQVLFVGRR